MYQLIIIGGGPAGITAGIYAARQKIKTLLITKDFGGQISWKAVNIENYPGFEEISGFDLVQKFEKQLKKQEIEIEKNEVVKIEKKDKLFLIKTKDDKAFEARTVIIASGGNHRSLGIPGEKEFLGKGVSYCTICDAPIFSNKRVAVIGGGNSAFESAISLTNWAEKVFILDYSEKPKADIENQENVLKTNKVEIISNAIIKEIKGEKFVESLIYTEKNNNQEIILPVQGVFIQVGIEPAVFFVEGLVELNEKKEIKSDPFSGETSCPGLFVAGDVSNIPFKQIVIAAGEGAKVALSAYYYLKK